MTASVAVAREAGAATTGVNAEDGSRTDDGYLFEFALAARDADASRVRYCDTIGGDPGVLRPARRVHPPRHPPGSVNCRPGRARGREVLCSPPQPGSAGPAAGAHPKG
jgi:hypothetical protein